MRVATILGTRPEIIRLSRVMPALDRYVEHTIIHTGQNYDYELNGVFFEDLELRRPDRYLNAAGDTAAETIGQLIARSDEALAEIKPDAVLILGDTNSCLAAISAKRLKIPLFHMEAGNRCFDERVPEEINRRIVDHISDINMPYSSIAREYLLREGIAPDRVIKTGSPMFEVLTHYRQKIELSRAMDRLGLIEGGFFVVSCHREENIESEEQFARLTTVLRRLAEVYGIPVVVTVHPRTRNRIQKSGAVFSEQIRLLKPLAMCDYVHLMTRARAVLSDSGTITEETSILNLRALNIREAHERPEGMEEGTVVMTGLREERVMEGLRLLERQQQSGAPAARLVPDYAVPNVSEKVVRIILSYTDYVNRKVWQKP